MSHALIHGTLFVASADVGKSHDSLTYKEWDFDLLEQLCSRAGMSEEWDAADGEHFESVAYAAAEKLGVKI